MSRSLPPPHLGPGLSSQAGPRALQRFMRADFVLSDQQFAAVTAPLGPGVVIAGAGSGKTTLMAARVVWLVGTGQVQPEEVLGLTFTTKAAAELSAKILRALNDAGILSASASTPQRARPAPDEDREVERLEPTVATYNAYAAGLLTDHGLRIGHEPDSRVITDAMRHQLAARVVDRHTGPVRHLSDHPPTVIGSLLSLESQLSEHLVGAEDILGLQRSLRVGLEESRALERRTTYRRDLEAALRAFDRRAELLDLVAEYRRLKRSLGLVEFSDQIALGARLALSRPEVGRAERRRFKVVLLDEYQDTSVAQARMLAGLFSGRTPSEGRGHPVTAVGDPHQAIYGWRGASVSNILRFGESFPDEDGSTAVPTYRLTVNRRSDRRILDLANALAAPLHGHHPQVQPLQVLPGAAAGSIAAELFETHPEEVARLAAAVSQARDRVDSWRDIGVLTRDNATAADVYDALTARDVPVEIVGLSGLLALPEVAEVVATLTVLQDLTANASLLLLLSGPRWAIGPRDLALLGQRAEELAGGRKRHAAEAGRPLDQELAEAVSGVDPAEVPSLLDALDDPGSRPYSTEARARFAMLAEELRRLRGHVGEPLVDLVRRIIDTTGIEIELASSVSPAARARRDNLDLFVSAVADFHGVDGEVSLPALLSYLAAEDEAGAGMEIAAPTGADTVKLLTVHRAKGLEWDVVFVVGLARGKFPTSQTRPHWLTSPSVLPSPLRGDAPDLPQLGGSDAAAVRAFAAECREHEQEEELRLAYVAFTRARHELAVSAYIWTDRKTPCGPSPYLEAVRDFLEAEAALEAGSAASGSSDPLPQWPALPESGSPNPLLESARLAPWPADHEGREVGCRRQGAALVRAAMARYAAGDAEDPHLCDPTRAPGGDDGLDPTVRDTVERWDREIERLLAEARGTEREVVTVPMPASLSATALSALRDEPAAFAASLARPMPRPPSPAARFGTRFHSWVEKAVGGQRQELLLDDDELSGRGDLEVAGEAEQRELIEAFERGPFAGRAAVEVETPFSIVLGGQVVRGRIDAVFAEGGGHLLVDWKTHHRHRADPLQLAVYRVAWAELRGVPLDSVRAGFYYVREGRLDVRGDLPGRRELEELVRPSRRPASR